MTQATTNDLTFLEHILGCIARIGEYTASGQSTFLASTMVQDAVIRNLQTLAESTQRLSQAAKDAEPTVPWRKVSGLRNVLAHGYLSVDLEVVWSIVVEDLPALEEAISRLRSRVDTAANEGEVG